MNIRLTIYCQLPEEDNLKVSMKKSTYKTSWEIWRKECAIAFNEFGTLIPLELWSVIPGCDGLRQFEPGQSGQFPGS